ncbi:hypothetical protein BGX29_008124 [Mortierella sp. GBA35]|nr:hypothetical protein BGX29_008124 [Mortierella sp. GBA35]
MALEGEDWVCNDLRVLRLRVEGFGDYGAINSCLKELQAIRAGSDWSLPKYGDVVDGVESTGHQIIRQLLKLPRLETVWLGTTDFYLTTK